MINLSADKGCARYLIFFELDIEPRTSVWSLAHKLKDPFRGYSSAGQSARLISVRSVVQVHLAPPYKSGGYSSIGRAQALQA